MATPFSRLRMTGLQAARELSRRRPELRILMLSMHDNEQYFFEALKTGASGYVLKSAANRDLIEACRATMRGEPFLYPAAVRALVRDYLDRASRGEETPEDPLTPRELEVVKAIAEGMTSDEIARELFISKKTVDRHRANVLEKLGMRNRVEGGNRRVELLVKLPAKDLVRGPGRRPRGHRHAPTTRNRAEARRASAAAQCSALGLGRAVEAAAQRSQRPPKRPRSRPARRRPGPRRPRGGAPRCPRRLRGDELHASLGHGLEPLAGYGEGPLGDVAQEPLVVAPGQKTRQPPVGMSEGNQGRERSVPGSRSASESASRERSQP